MNDESHTIRLYHCSRFGDDEFISEKSVTLESLTLPEILSAVEEWLRGAGFYFDGHLDFVED